MAIYFTRYVDCKSMKMLSLHFYKLMGEIEEREGKNILLLMIIRIRQD